MSFGFVTVIAVTTQAESALRLITVFINRIRNNNIIGDSALAPAKTDEAAEFTKYMLLNLYQKHRSNQPENLNFQISLRTAKFDVKLYIED